MVRDAGLHLSNRVSVYASKKVPCCFYGGDESRNGLREKEFKECFSTGIGDSMGGSIRLIAWRGAFKQEMLRLDASRFD